MVESLEKKRQPFPQLEAVYIVSNQSITKVLSNFDRRDKPLYGAAHIFSITRLLRFMFRFEERF